MNGQNTSTNSSPNTISSGTYTYNVPLNGGSITINGASITGSGHATGLNYQSVLQNTSVTGVLKKVSYENIRYCIKKQNGSVLVLQETNPTTPKKLIGICKFITCVQKMEHGVVDFSWLTLIESLDIVDQFTEYSVLPSAPSTLDVMLQA